MSFPEKFVYSLLKYLKVNFETQKRFKWLSNRYYDFYLTDMNVIVEVHGEQHYRTGNFNNSAEDLKNQVATDTQKRTVALAKGISDYVEIEAMKSEFEYLRENVLLSSLKEMLSIDNVEWKKVMEDCSKSIYLEILSAWNLNKTVMEISEIVKLNRNTVARVLRNFDSSGLCVYDSKRGRRREFISSKSKDIKQKRSDI